MRQTYLRTTALFLLPLVVLTGCGLAQPPAVRLIRQATVKYRETADLLVGVKDAASAKAAAPRLKQLIDEMDKLHEQIERVHDPEEVDFDDHPAVTKAVVESIQEMQRLMAEVARIGKEKPLREGLGDSWDRLSGYDVSGIDPLGTGPVP
jgi:formaldehyde-activating enzyme involved in methanogenesis